MSQKWIPKSRDSTSLEYTLKVLRSLLNNNRILETDVLAMLSGWFQALYLKSESSEIEHLTTDINSITGLDKLQIRAYYDNFLYIEEGLQCLPYKRSQPEETKDEEDLLTCESYYSELPPQNYTMNGHSIAFEPATNDIPPYWDFIATSDCSNIPSVSTSLYVSCTCSHKNSLCRSCECAKIYEKLYKIKGPVIKHANRIRILEPSNLNIVECGDMCSCNRSKCTLSVFPIYDRFKLYLGKVDDYWRVFTSEFINKGDIVIELAGTLTNLPTDNSIPLGENMHLDRTRSNVSKFMRISHNPNLAVLKIFSFVSEKPICRLVACSLEDIQAHEELTIKL